MTWYIDKVSEGVSRTLEAGSLQQEVTSAVGLDKHFKPEVPFCIIGLNAKGAALSIR